MTDQMTVGLAGITLAIFLVGCQQSVEKPEPVRPVRTVRVGDLQAISGREFPGRAEAKDDVELSFQVAGPLISLPVDVGTEVKKGDVIAAIDPVDFETMLANAEGSLAKAKANLLAMERGARPEEIEQLKAALESAEAAYEVALAEYERDAELVKSNAASQFEVDVSKARRDQTAAAVKSAKESLNIGMTGARPEDIQAQKAEIQALEASVKAAKNQLGYATLKAPFDGEVAAVYVDNFQTVQAKMAIARLLDLSAIEITVQIPESLIGLIPQVKSVICRFDAIKDKEFTGVVTKIGREASQTTRTYPVTVEIDQPEETEILPGMAAMVRNQPMENETNAVTQLIVPPAAVFTGTDESETYVWVVDANNKVTQRTVRTGKLTPVGLGIEEGLESGEVVVISGVNSLREGQEVKVP